MRLKVTRTDDEITIWPEPGLPLRNVWGQIDKKGIEPFWNDPQINIQTSDCLTLQEGMQLAKLIAKVTIRTQQEYLKIPKKERL